MSQPDIFWDPTGTTVDILGSDRFLRASDGDTPYLSMSIRMLSIDTPEIHYPGRTNPSRHDANLAQLAAWIAAGQAPIQTALGQYLRPKLATGQAGTLHKQQGDQATLEFRNIVQTKLTRPNRRNRGLFIRAADEHFDQYGRLLAYLAPKYSSQELESMSRTDRATFNLLMVETGWAAMFPIYPSIPRYPDLVLLREAAKQAYEQQLGAWANPLTLTGYELRMCVRLYGITKRLVNGEKLYGSKKYGWIERYCVDMITRKIYSPQQYHQVQPYNRIFVWPRDIVDAVARMNLRPA
jgi:endonuclease YncB( thermonuclease family)